jgi:hypothetical protein
MRLSWNEAPFLLGFEPSLHWPDEDFARLLAAARSNAPIALFGPPGAAFAAAVWTTLRSRSKAGSDCGCVDLSRLSLAARSRAWNAPETEGELCWMEHAELIPTARRTAGATVGRIASFVLEGKPRPPVFGAWSVVEVPPIGRYLRLEESIQAAWRHLTGEGLSRSLVAVLASHPCPGDAEGLERLLVESAALGKEGLSTRLGVLLELGLGGSSWKRRKRQMEREMLGRALEKNGGNRTKTAQALGLHRNTVLWHLRKWKGSTSKN